MYAIPWFEEDIQVKTELHAYLSPLANWNMLRALVLLYSGLLRRLSFTHCWYCCHLFEYVTRHTMLPGSHLASILMF